MAKKKQEKKSEAPQEKVSLDEQIGKGLSPQPNLDQEKNDYASHPKFNKFNQTGSQ